MRYLPLYLGPMPRDIPEAFGYHAPYRCGTCGPIQEIHSVETIPGSWDGPGDGFDYCPICGSEDVFASDDPKPFRAIRRRRIHPGHHTGIAA